MQKSKPGNEKQLIIIDGKTDTRIFFSSEK